MKLQKLIMMIVFVALFFLSFTAYGNNVDNLIVNRAPDPQDDAVNKLMTIYQQFVSYDEKEFEGILNENVIWKYEGVTGVVPYAGTYAGKTGVKKFWRTFLDSVSNPRAELRYYVHQGNFVDLHWTEEGIVKATGKKYAMETVQRWEFNDQGQVIKVRWYNDTYAVYQAFQQNTDPQLSIALHPADYNINGNGPNDNASTIVQTYYNDLQTGNLTSIINGVAPNFVFILAGPVGLTKIAGTWYGPQGLTDFFNTLFTYESYNYLVLETYTTDGPRVDVEFKEEIVIKPTGKVADCEGLHSFVVYTNGQLAKFRSYNDTYSVAIGYTN